MCVKVDEAHFCGSTPGTNNNGVIHIQLPPHDPRQARFSDLHKDPCQGPASGCRGGPRVCKVGPEPPAKPSASLRHIAC